MKLIINHKTRNDEAPNGPQKHNASMRPAHGKRAKLMAGQQHRAGRMHNTAKHGRARDRQLRGH
jgi:hypothetical protein